MVTGCICDSLTIDGIEEINLSDEKRKEVLNRIFPHINSSDLNELLQWFLPKYGEYEGSDKPCDCCGDYIDTYTLNI